MDCMVQCSHLGRKSSRSTNPSLAKIQCALSSSTCSLVTVCANRTVLLQQSALSTQYCHGLSRVTDAAFDNSVTIRKDYDVSLEKLSNHLRRRFFSNFISICAVHVQPLADIP